MNKSLLLLSNAVSVLVSLFLSTQSLMSKTNLRQSCDLLVNKNSKRGENDFVFSA